MKNNYIKLAELSYIHIIDGDRGKNYPSTGELMSSGFCLFLNAGNVTEKGFVFNELKYITKQKDELLRNGKLERNDIILTTRGTVGNVAIYDKSIPFDHVRINSGMVIIRVDESKIIPQYLYNILRSANVQNQINSLKTGSAQPQLPISLIKEIKIPILDTKEQQAIADVLSSFDDKIELNNKIIRNLEEQAQSLYKYWFIDFEFPNEEGKPYKSSRGKLKKTELGLIPESWEISPLSHFVKKNNKKFNVMKEWENLNIIDLSVMPQFSVNINEFSKGSDFTTNIYKLEEYDLLFGSIRSYFGKAGFSPISGGVTGTVHSFKPVNTSYYSFLLETITHKGFIDKTVKLSSGTKMPIINWDAFSNILLVVSKDGIVEKQFNDVIINNIEKIKTSILENKKLEETRDYLLQKLMSGEIQVTDVK